MSKATPQRRAFSYVRFSTAAQAEGGSISRQRRLSQAYAERKQLLLDDSLTLDDLGVSAYRGDNVRDGALAGFLEACRLGRVPRGSVLIVESLDRLSRDQIRPALQLFMALQDHGITIVTLQPEREYPPDSVDALSLIEPLIVFARAHEESAMKSHRRADGWKQARDRARAGGGHVMKTCPAWLEVTKDGFVERPEAVAAVRRIFALAREGMGVARITAQLTTEKVPAIGSGDRWVKAYVYRILANPAAMGVYQPHRQDGKRSVPEGEPIAGHYPAVVSEQEWQEAQAAMQARGGDFDASGKFRKGGTGVRGAGRKGIGEPNLFSGLVRFAPTGENMHLIHARGRKVEAEGERKKYVYLAQTRDHAGVSGERIDYHVFEEAILSKLKELRPADITATIKPTNDGKEEMERLNSRLLDIDNKLERAKQRARSSDDFDVFLDLIQELQAERKAVAARRAELEQEVGASVADLDEAHSLIELLAATPVEQREDVRRRLRVRIAQLITGIWLVIARQGKKCVCAAQIYFRGSDKRRDYIIVHTPGTRYTTGQWQSVTLVKEHAKGELDLRKLEHATRLAAALEVLPLEHLGPE